MKKFIALLFSVTIAQAVIIQSSNRVDWIPGYTVGVQGGAIWRTNLIDVTLAPYGADKTGVTNAQPAIQSAVDAAVAGDVVYVPDGKYRINGQVALNKSGITLRGESTNAVLVGVGSSSALIVGHGLLPGDANRSYTVTNGGSKGTTNLVLSNIQNGYGDTIKAGDMLVLGTGTRNQGSESFPIISTANYDGIIKQVVVISSRVGNTVNISAPLVWDFTNSPGLQELSTVDMPRTNVGVENISVTLTNNGEVGTSSFVVEGYCLQNCWFTNVNIGFSRNYHLYLVADVNVTVTHCTFHDSLSSGTSHAGLILANDTGLLIENNIWFTTTYNLFPGIEVNDGVNGTVIFANYFSGCDLDIDVHNTHPMMNLYEANKSHSFIEFDGYFGSASHFTLLRNHIPNTLPIKKFNSRFQIVGNVLGSTNGNYQYSTEQSGYGAPYPLLEMGFPAIGNNTYTGTSPPDGWNFPGNPIFGFHGESLPNGIFVFTNTQINTNIVYGNFTNIPPDLNGVVYALIFQDGVNTNLYYGALNFDALHATAVTASNMTLNTPVTVSNGWRVLIAGQQAYQQLHSLDKLTHTIHGNAFFTNGIGVDVATLVWATNIADHNIPASLIYTNGAPGWWGTNRWPAVQPESSPMLAVIPAENRYNGILNGACTNVPSNVTGLSVTPGDSQNVLTWSAAPCDSGYHIALGTTSGGHERGYAFSGSAGYTDSGLANGTTYYYKVLSTNANGAALAFSSVASGTPAQAPPATPTVTATAGDTQIILDWGADATADGFRIARGTVSGMLTALTNIAGHRWTNTGLVNGSIRYYTVTATNEAGESVSSEVSATPAAPVVNSYARRMIIGSKQ
jgi:hypothetical protein